MSLPTYYRRKRLRQLGALRGNARREALNALLRGDSRAVKIWQKRATTYGAEIAILHKPPYWHRHNYEAWQRVRYESMWADWSGAGEMNIRGSKTGRITPDEIFRQEYQLAP